MADSISLRDLADQLSAKLNVTKSAAYEALGETFCTINATVGKGNKVAIFQFGTFSQKSRKARTGRNPQTGAAIKIAASKSVGFKPSKSAAKAKAAKKAAPKKAAKK